MIRFSRIQAIHIFLFSIFLLCLIIFFQLLVIPTKASIAVDCNSSVWPVSTQTELNAAVGCYNDVTTSGSYTISLTQGISLTKSTLTISNSTTDVSLLIEGNGFAIDGQHIFGVRPLTIAKDTVVTLHNITITRGKTNKLEHGGGIYNEGILTINNSTIHDNEARGNRSGGGIYSGGTLLVENSTISQNTTNERDGGGIYSSGITTITNSVIISNVVGIYSGAGVASGGILTIDNTLISGNRTKYYYGGGVVFYRGKGTISNSTISNNSVGYEGGGVFVYDGELTIINSTLANNNSDDRGGAIGNYGTIIVTNSTIYGNISDSTGGGIHNYDTATIINSTISNNTTVNVGGGIANYRAMAVIDTTISGNMAGDGGDSIYNGDSFENVDTLEITNSIIHSNHIHTNCVVEIEIKSNGYNLDSDGSCGLTEASDISNMDPLLGILQDNGGATWTHALLEGSPAIDTGSTTSTEDQRGVSRPQGKSDDIGAYEVVSEIEDIAYRIYIPIIVRSSPN